ncbi:hypothetical protein SH139x_002297 [Planctomycetaceae bacterium SH139]
MAAATALAYKSTVGIVFDSLQEVLLAKAKRLEAEFSLLQERNVMVEH